MGDRAQIAIKMQNDHRIYLYGHWIGEDIYPALQKALNDAPDRHEDSEYLARVIFDRMKGNNTESTTGFAIGTCQHIDIEHIVPVVDCDKQIIEFDKRAYSTQVVPKPITFKDYASLADIVAYCEPREETEEAD